MPLLVSSSRHRSRLERETVPPLFAGILRDERTTAEFETALQETLKELSEDRYVAGLGKFQEALGLSRGHAALEQQLREAAASEAARLMPDNWRVAEAMLFEVEQASGRSAEFDKLWAGIERQKSEDTIRLALAGSEPDSEYLPHLRDRLLRLAEVYPEDGGLNSRLRDVERMISRYVEDDREKNLGRLTLFRERLNESDNPATLRNFCTLVAPFADAYTGDHDFAIILDEVRSLQSAYEKASALLSDQRSRESLEICHRLLASRPRNILFLRLAEQARRCAETEAEPELAGHDSPADAFASLANLAMPGATTLGLKIAITEEAWNHLKVGLAAAAALLLVVLLLASNSGR